MSGSALRSNGVSLRVVTYGAFLAPVIGTAAIDGGFNR